MNADIVTLNDPMKGIIDYNINKFETRYAQMYSQAIVILPKNDEASEKTETAAENDDISDSDNEGFPSEDEAFDDKSYAEEE